MSTKQARMYEKISNHGEALKKFFKLPETTDPVKLCKKLFSLENKAHKLATDYCNGMITDSDYDNESDHIMERVYSLLGKDNRILFNGDCRGYTLKIDEKYLRDTKTAIYRDMGGYGIIAPDFQEVK